MNTQEINQKLKRAGLKLTPQRQAIYEAVVNLGNHPSVDNILDYIRERHPGIATGTVYNVLDTLVDHGLVRRVRTERDAMRYDGIGEKHHHLYSAETDRIEDYYDSELDAVLKEYFRKKGIKNFEIKDIVLQIKGDFKN